MNSTNILILLLLFFTSIPLGLATCHHYEIEAFLQCPQKQRACELVLYQGSFSERKIFLKQSSSEVYSFHKKFVRVNVVMESQEKQSAAILIDRFPLEIAAPINLGSIKDRGESKCL